MDKSDTIADLAAALVQAQPEFKAASKDSTNPFFKSKYADLGAVWEAVHEGLKKYGLTVSQFPDHVGDAPALTTMLIHKSGQWISSTYPLMVTDKECTPQGYGSALTYARRYGLSAVLGVVADEDDDGNQSSGRKPSQATPKSVTSLPAKTDAHAENTAASKPKMTPAEWAMQELSIIRACPTPKALKEWENANAVALHRLKLVDPGAHQDLLDNLDARAKALLAA